MRQPQDAAAVLRELHRHALAHAAEAVERVLGKEAEIPDRGKFHAGVLGFVEGLMATITARGGGTEIISATGGHQHF